MKNPLILGFAAVIVVLTVGAYSLGRTGKVSAANALPQSQLATATSAANLPQKPKFPPGGTAPLAQSAWRFVQAALNNNLSGVLPELDQMPPESYALMPRKFLIGDREGIATIEVFPGMCIGGWSTPTGEVYDCKVYCKMQSGGETRLKLWIHFLPLPNGQWKIVKVERIDI